MEPNDAASSSARAHEMRASLGARREVEALLAEASATREAAVADADAIIEEAQHVSEQLLRESRSEADRLTTEARQRAEGMVARARSEAEDITRQGRAAADAVRARAEAQVEEHRRRVRAELTEQVTREVGEKSRRELAKVHERQQAMIGDLEASVRILGVSMEAAVSNIAEMLGALDSLRTHTAESLGDAPVASTSTSPAPPFPAPARHAEPLDHLIRSTTPPPEGPRDVGSIFDNPAPTSSVPASDPVYDVDRESGEGSDGAEPPDVDGADEERPMTATEAFLLSAHLDHGDPPLPPMDDADVGDRYARDAMRVTARAKSRTEPPSPEPGAESAHEGSSSGQDPEDAQASAAQQDREDTPETDTSGKPLGWLFRSS